MSGRRGASRPGRLLATLAVAGALFVVPTAAAATGDLVANVTTPDGAFVAGDLFGGVGVAFDGHFLYYTNEIDADLVLHRIRPCIPMSPDLQCDGTDHLDVPIVGAPNGISTLSFDVTRNEFWAVSSGIDLLTFLPLYNIYLLQLDNPANPTSAVATLQFVIHALNLPGDCDNGIGCSALVDGLAYDANDDSIWFSPDGSQRVYHFDIPGPPLSSRPFGADLLGFFDVNDSPDDMAPSCPTVGNYSSGVAVGSATLWLTADGCGYLFEYGRQPTYLPPFPSGDPCGTRQYCPGSLIPPPHALGSFTPGVSRAEDDECDNVTFPSKNVLWVRDAFDGHIRAFETPVGSCIFGGGAALLQTARRMTGGGSFLQSPPNTGEVRHGFMLHCDAAPPLSVKPNRLEVTWGNGERFHLTNIASSSCSDSPLIMPNPPGANFDTISITGTGRYDGMPGATIKATFTDAGEPGTMDSAKVTITTVDSTTGTTTTVLDAGGNLTGGNQQAHGG